MKQIAENRFPTLVDRLWPKRHQTHALASQVALVLFGSLFVALCARVEIPFFPVPITGQTFAVLLIGLSFGWRLAGATMALYLVEGAMGMPVFSGGSGGAWVFATPSAGYLLGFLPAAMACGYLAEHGYGRKVFKVGLAMVVGHAVVFASGLLGLGMILGFDKPLLALGFAPFVPGLLIKSALVALLLPAAHRCVDTIKGR